MSVSDGQYTATETVKVAVNNSNDAPVCPPSASFTVDENVNNTVLGSTYYTDEDYFDSRLFVFL